MKKMRKILSMLLLVAMVLSLAACGGGQTSETKGATASAEPGKTKTSYKFGVIYTANNAFWDSVGNGALAKAAEYNATGEYDIEVVPMGPTDSGAAQQIQIFEDMMSKGYNGIIISCSDAVALQPVIDAAADKGVPVVCMDAEVPNSKRLCFVGTDNYNFGAALGEEIAKVLGGKGKVILTSMNPAMTAMTERMRGTTECLAKYPDIEVLIEYYETDFANIIGNIENLAAKYSDFDLMAMNYAAGEQIANVWRSKGWTAKDKHAVVSDDLDPILVAVEEGVLDSTLVQGQYNWGYEGIRVLVEYLHDGVTPPAFVETPAHVVDAETAKVEYPNVKPAN